MPRKNNNSRFNTGKIEYYGFPPGTSRKEAERIMSNGAVNNAESFFCDQGKQSRNDAAIQRMLQPSRRNS